RSACAGRGSAGRSGRGSRRGLTLAPGVGWRTRLVRARSICLRSLAGAVTGTVEGEDTPPIATMGPTTPRPLLPGRTRGEHAFPEPARLAASGRPPQARHPARREDRAQEVPRGRSRTVLAARLRGACR